MKKLCLVLSLLTVTFISTGYAEESKDSEIQSYIVSLNNRWYIKNPQKEVISRLRSLLSTGGKRQRVENSISFLLHHATKANQRAHQRKSVYELNLIARGNVADEASLSDIVKFYELMVAESSHFKATNNHLMNTDKLVRTTDIKGKQSTSYLFDLYEKMFSNILKRRVSDEKELSPEEIEAIIKILAIRSSDNHGYRKKLRSWYSSFEISDKNLIEKIYGSDYAKASHLLSMIKFIPNKDKYEGGVKVKKNATHWIEKLISSALGQDRAESFNLIEQALRDRTFSPNSIILLIPNISKEDIENHTELPDLVESNFNDLDIVNNNPLNVGPAEVFEAVSRFIMLEIGDYSKFLANYYELIQGKDYYRRHVRIENLKILLILLEGIEFLDDFSKKSLAMSIFKVLVRSDKSKAENEIKELERRGASLIESQLQAPYIDEVKRLEEKFSSHGITVNARSTNNYEYLKTLQSFERLFFDRDNKNNPSRFVQKNEENIRKTHFYFGSHPKYHWSTKVKDDGGYNLFVQVGFDDGNNWHAIESLVGAWKTGGEE